MTGLDLICIWLVDLWTIKSGLLHKPTSLTQINSSQFKKKYLTTSNSLAKIWKSLYNLQTNFEGNRLRVVEFQIQLQKGFKPNIVAKAAAATEDEGRKKLITLCVYHSENCARAFCTVFPFEKIKFIWQYTKYWYVLIFPFNSVLNRNTVSFSLWCQGLQFHFIKHLKNRHLNFKDLPFWIQWRYYD